MALIESDGITDFLNRLEYITTIHNADRELTEEYKETVALVEEQERTLLSKMDELLVKQETFLGQQAEIEYMIAELEGAQSEFADALAAAEAQAEQYRDTIEKQNEIIRQEQASNSNPPTYEGGQNVSGQDIVNFAKQYVGNPYVWGGNSLTDGCDCSGFVHLVYKNFGYNTVRYSMSFIYEGVAVSREDVQPGDIVVYAIKNGIGHVAIYAGNGKIVEAQSKKTGITDNRSIDCREIVGIRRIIK
jgi:cell wall-associated NlpC family hydrolase